MGQPTLLMNLLVLSDLHLSPQTLDRNKLFLNFLEQALAKGDEVLLLGDIFDLWFGREALTFSFQSPILERMKQLKSLGLRMDYVEGNRDFYISRYAGAIFQQVSSDSYHRRWGQYTLHAEHGDCINLDDKPYRFFRRLTKNSVAQLLIDCMPSRFLLGQADRLERKMRNTNLKYKMHYPEAHCKRFIDKTAAENADLIIVGHFHEEKSWEVKCREKNVLFFNLPGWESGFRYLVIPDTAAKPYFKEEGQQVHGNPATS